MDYKDLIMRVNKDRQDLENMVDSVVSALVNSENGAEYLYSKQINKLYFIISCTDIDLKSFEVYYGWFLDKIK